MPLRRLGLDLSKKLFLFPIFWGALVCSFLLPWGAHLSHANPLITSEELHRVELLLTPSVNRLMLRIYPGNTQGALESYFRRVLRLTRDRPLFVTFVRDDSGHLLGLTILHQDINGESVNSHARLHVYFPDEILFDSNLVGSLREVFAQNISREQSTQHSRIPVLAIGPEEQFKNEQESARRKIATMANNPTVNGLRQGESDDHQISRRDAVNRIVETLGFHVPSGGAPRLIPTQTERAIVRPLNPFPQIHVDRVYLSSLSGYQWFGTHDSEEHYFGDNGPRFYADLERNFPAFLDPDSQRGLSPLLAEHPELNRENLSLGFTAFAEDKSLAFQTAAFRHSFGPSLRSTLLLIAKASTVDSQVQSILFTALEQMIRRESSNWLFRVLPPKNARIRLLIGAQNSLEEERLLVLLERWLERSRIRQELAERGVTIDLSNYTRRERERGTPAKSEWQTFDFIGSPAFGHVRVVVLENQAIEILEEKTFRIEGSAYRRWRPVQQFPLLVTLGNRAAIGLTRRHLVFPLENGSMEMHVIRGHGGWRAEVRPFCQKNVELGEG